MRRPPEKDCDCPCTTQNMWKYIDRYLSIAVKINQYRCRLTYATASGYRCDLAAAAACYLGKICKCSSLHDDTRRDRHFNRNRRILIRQPILDSDSFYENLWNRESDLNRLITKKRN